MSDWLPLLALGLFLLWGTLTLVDFGWLLWQLGQLIRFGLRRLFRRP